MKEYKTRDDVPDKYRCDLSDFYENEDEWINSLDETRQKVSELLQYKEHIKRPLEFEKYIKTSIEIENEIENLAVYAYLNHLLDLKNEKYSAMLNQITAFDTEYAVQTAFFTPFLVSLKEEEFYDLFKKNPNLENYRFLLEEIYIRKAHMLSEHEEKLVSQLTETVELFSEISTTLVDSCHEYGSVKIDNENITIASSNYHFLQHNKSRKIRKQVENKFKSKLVQYQDIAATLLYGFVKNQINLSKIRHYESAWQEKLEDYKLPNEVFQNLIDTANKNTLIFQQYIKLYCQNLGVKQLHDYDLSADWGKQSKQYTIEESQELVLKSLSILGTEYQDKIKLLFNKRTIDYCQYKDKFSGGCSISSPTKCDRIVLSFNGSYHNVSTIAHELGHSVHSLFKKNYNPSWYADTHTVISEIASLTNEFLLNHYIYLNGATLEEKLMGIEQTLKTIDNNFFGAIIEGKIEQDMYEYVEKGNSITASFMNELEKKYKDQFYCNLVDFDYSTQWITRSHYYNFFYLFDYAICVSIAAMIANKIIHKEKGMLERYYEFLSCGSDKSPEEVYKTLGVDIRNPDIFNEVVLYFKEQIDLYKKLKKEGEVNE